MTRSRWKIFLLSLIAQFAVTAFLHLGVRVPKALNFLSLNKEGLKSAEVFTGEPRLDVLEKIKPYLKKQENNFHLLKQESLVPQVLASSLAESAQAFIVVDLGSGNILEEKNSSQKLPVASLTKIMTAVVALDLAAPNELFEVSLKASEKEPTTIGVVEGERMSLQELLRAALMTSANDATEVVKEGINQKYQQDVFIWAMNYKAQVLNLEKTSFANPQGFDHQKNFSSASDLAVLSAYALKNYPLISEISSQNYQFLPEDQNHKQFDLYNWNGLLGVYPGVFGLKIGNTGQAGYTTVVTAKRDNREVLVVLLKAPGVLERDLWASQLLDLGFEKLGLTPIGITEADLQDKYSTWKYWN